MLPQLDLVENHYANYATSFKEKCLRQGTIVTLIFLLTEKTLNYGCIHLDELNKNKFRT
jgi:hypothetical protein